VFSHKTMPWVFEIAAGSLYDPAGAFAATVYAGGDVGKDLSGVNNPADESIPDVGPLPEGNYTFGTPLDHSVLGPFAIPLQPDAANDMHGRRGFFVHGDLIGGAPHSGSEGCIVTPRPTREAMWASADHSLQVVATR
jgi:hypothetical protein